MTVSPATARPKQHGLWVLLAVAAVVAAPGVWYGWSRWSRPAPPQLGTAADSAGAQLIAARAEAEKSPDDPRRQLRLGRLLLASGRPGEARASLAVACGHPATAAAAAVLLAQAATDPAAAAGALPDAQKAVASARDDPRAWEGLIRVLFAGGQSGSAKTMLDQARRRFPAAPRLRFIQAEVAADEGDARTAVTLYEQALKELPDPHAYLMLGLVCARTKATKKAREAFRRSIELEPESLAAHLGLAKTELELGLTADAETTAFSALRIAPADPEAILMLARVLVQKGDPPSQRTARELLDRTIQLAPGNMDAYFYLGQVKLRAGDGKGAARALETVILAQPQRMDARQAYVRALKQSGDTKNADIQAKLVAQLTELEQLRLHLTARVSQSPADPTARCDLADFYLQHGAVPMAVRQYQKALELDPRSPRAAEGLRRAGGAP